MSTLPVRQKLIEIARREVGVREVGRNSGKRVREYQAACDLAKEQPTGWPWCAAFVCWCIQEWGKDKEVLAALKLTAAQFEKWRPKTAAAFGLEDWAKKRGLQVLFADDIPSLRTGDIVTFDMSHTGLVVDDARGVIKSIEGNTGASGGREGDGVWDKSRNFKESRKFIRLLPP
jgi:hypothetical protein